MIKGEKCDNFRWPPGKIWPCWPCAEFHYDRGENRGPNDRDIGENDRFIEIRNNVFMEYYQDAFFLIDMVLIVAFKNYWKVLFCLGKVQQVILVLYICDLCFFENSLVFVLFLLTIASMVVIITKLQEHLFRCWSLLVWIQII
jgi:hypothetical protein